MMTSMVLLAPMPELELLDELLERLGWGRNNLLAVVAPSATHTPTHRGLRASVSEISEEVLENALHEDTALAGRVVLVSDLTWSASGISKLFWKQRAWSDSARPSRISVAPPRTPKPPIRAPVLSARTGWRPVLAPFAP